MRLRMLLGLLFGALFIWIVARGLSEPAEQQALREAIATMRWLPLIPYIGLVAFYHVLRVWRWRLLLREHSRPFRTLFSINMVGFLAVNLLPARLGELVRPLLLAGREGVPVSVSLATALIERILDFLTMLLVLALVVFAVDMPAPVIQVGGKPYDILAVVRSVFLLAALPVVGGLVGLILLEEWMYRLWHWVADPIVPTFAARFEAFCRSFVQALAPLRQPRLLAVQILLTLCIWSITLGTEWLMFRVFHLDHLGIDAALTVVGAILIGLLIPGPPGFAGNFEAFCMGGLAVFGVTGGVALGYALMLHWTQFLQVNLMGLYYLWRDGISFSSLFSFSRSLEPEKKGEQGSGAA